MALLTYQEARPYARAMKQRTTQARTKYQRGVMPPWFIEKNIGIQNFKNDPSLTDKEIDTIAAWADAGAPEGDPKDLPPPIKLASVTAWALGKPDLIATTPPIAVKGVAPDQWIDLFECCTAIDNAPTEDRYIASAEYKETPISGPPRIKEDGTVGSLWVIHHTGAAITDGPPAEGSGRRYRLTAHEVGRNAVTLPADAGVPLRVGSQVEWSQFHLHSPGVPGADVVSKFNVGLKLYPRGYKPKYEMVSYASFGNTELEIAAGAADQKAEAYFVAPRPMKLVNFEPHMHADGVRKCLQAIYQRSVETLNCAGYDHNWVRDYQYQDDYMPLIPKGTILKATAWFDNSAANNNVIEPRNQANWGRRAVVNMLIMFNDGILLTDEQYEQELAKRREFLDRTNGWDTVIGCPGCWEQPSATTSTAKKSAPAGKSGKVPNLSQGASAEIPELGNVGSSAVD
jgi:hypothetical protein